MRARVLMVLVVALFAGCNTFEDLGQYSYDQSAVDVEPELFGPAEPLRTAHPLAGLCNGNLDCVGQANRCYHGHCRVACGNAVSCLAEREECVNTNGDRCLSGCDPSLHYCRPIGACESNMDCDGNAVCHDRQCIEVRGRYQTCSANAPCHPRLSCLRGQCQVPQPDGFPCEDDRDCQLGHCDTGAGLCRAEDPMRCSSEKPCPAGWICFGNSTNATCIHHDSVRCSEDTHCGLGYYCEPGSPYGRCVQSSGPWGSCAGQEKHCAVDLMCSANFRCEVDCEIDASCCAGGEPCMAPTVGQPCLFACAEEGLFCTEIVKGELVDRVCVDIDCAQNCTDSRCHDALVCRQP
jgi:hypothetical protein